MGILYEANLETPGASGFEQTNKAIDVTILMFGGFD